MIAQNPHNYDLLKRLAKLLKDDLSWPDKVSDILDGVAKPLDYDRSSPEPVKAMIVSSSGWAMQTIFERTLDSLFKDVGDLEVVVDDVNYGLFRLARDYAVDRGHVLRKLQMPDIHQLENGVDGGLDQALKSVYNVACCTHLVAFWDGYDRDVERLIELAKLAELKMRVFLVRGRREHFDDE